MSAKPADCTCPFPERVARNMSGHDQSCPAYARWLAAVVDPGEGDEAGPINLCTYFDEAYLLKGLALLRSIEKHLPCFRVFVLALDPGSLKAIEAAYPGDPRISVIPLPAIEGDELWRIKPKRSRKEYIWSLTAPWMTYVFDTYRPADLAYIDADCYLLGDLAPLYAEVAGRSIGIIPHNWTPRHAGRLRKNGIFNVGWVYFRDDFSGRSCLASWRKDTFEWRRQGPEIFSDQIFLDEWPALFLERLAQIRHPGANLAPWNQERYEYRLIEGRLVLRDPAALTVDSMGIGQDPPWEPILFYHFHELRHDATGKITYRTGYPLAAPLGGIVYAEYERALQDACRVAKPQ